MREAKERKKNMTDADIERRQSSRGPLYRGSRSKTHFNVMEHEEHVRETESLFPFRSVAVDFSAQKYEKPANF